MIFWLPGTEKALEERYGTKREKNSRVKSNRGRMFLMVALLACSAGLLGLIGCANLTPQPSPGQQTITITATGSGNVTQSISLQVTVQ